MKLGIMQPYFFPYLGYFELINQVDKWLAFDIVQYNSKSWMSRNRVLHPKEGWQYINAPVVKCHHTTPISEIKVKDQSSALNTILGKLSHYKSKAPYYNETIDIVKESFGKENNSSLVRLNMNILSTISAYLIINFDYELCSSLKLELPSITHPGQWAVEISDALGATEYINPPGGKDIFLPHEFKQRNIKLSFIEPIKFRYDTLPYQFESQLSILDVMMWNSVEEIQQYLSRNNINNSSKKIDNEE